MEKREIGAEVRRMEMRKLKMVQQI